MPGKILKLSLSDRSHKKSPVLCNIPILHKAGVHSQFHIAADRTDKKEDGSRHRGGVNLKQGYNGDLTSKQAGSVGGQMVKKMFSYEH